MNWDLAHPAKRKEFRDSVLAQLDTERPTTTREIVNTLGCSHEQVREVLNRLRAEGLAKPLGTTRNRSWLKC